MADIKEVLRQKAAVYYKKSVDTIDDNAIIEFLENGKTVKVYGHEEHRWYTMFSKVIELDGMFLDFEDYVNSGDEPAFSREEHAELILSSIVQVYPKEITTTDYVTKDKL